ncbi:hypothetical protein [Celeribacter litoreus]|uniref:hypothetical protein n=1 Tax=Celeribacter litoreus TaxID=2876714 RepID=UPI001CCBA0F7|nr:hypothetical protein [Celeribacter litoreus]MCA0042702.1 hypothetical protein [Celeribacter litoreus]
MKYTKIKIFTRAVAITVMLMNVAALYAALPPERSMKPKADVLVVRNDLGGNVVSRVEKLRELSSKETKVMLLGPYCLSSCTLYLAMEEVCVAPKAHFGFHAPEPAYGQKLTEEELDEWSVYISNFYPPEVKAWYLKKARYQHGAPLMLSGSTLISFGVENCDDWPAPPRAEMPSGEDHIGGAYSVSEVTDIQ